MLLNNPANETPFEASFDARFPYEDTSAAASLIQQGWATSLNAAFCVLEELCRPPKSTSVSRDRLRALVTEWANGPSHPLKAPVLHAACALIENKRLSWQQGVELMKRVGDYDGQRAALNIVYFASDSGSAEADRALERTRLEVCERWEAKRV